VWHQDVEADLTHDAPGRPSRSTLGRERIMSDARGSVAGSASNHQVLFYGLSTCVWCKRTREFLEESGVGFDYVYVDLLEGDERARALEDIRKVNPKTNFPTVVVDGDVAVVGYDPDRLKEALAL
jgi:glutaredoxin